MLLIHYCIGTVLLHFISHSWHYICCGIAAATIDANVFVLVLLLLSQVMHMSMYDIDLSSISSSNNESSSSSSSTPKLTTRDTRTLARSGAQNVVVLAKVRIAVQWLASAQPTSDAAVSVELYGEVQGDSAVLQQPSSAAAAAAAAVATSGKIHKPFNDTLASVLTVLFE
jgi:hypothetical protein